MTKADNVVLNYLNSLKPESHLIKEYSDVWFEEAGESDSAKNKRVYFVDLVMEGGGMLGLALVGYTYILELHNIRFRAVAGTSAGAINALALSAAGSPNEVKSRKIAEILEDTNFAAFVDGPWFVKSSLKIMSSKCHWAYKLATRFIQHVLSIFYLVKHKGLNKGENFQHWMSKVLQEMRFEGVGATSLKELKKRWSLPGNLTVHTPNGVLPAERYNSFGALAIVSSCLTAGQQVTFPKDADLFYKDIENIHVADFARASMSVPIFFQPFTIANLPPFEETTPKWKQRFGRDVSAYQRHAEKMHFVDGGILSNFPFEIFHSKRAPQMPTFGVKLGIDRFRNRNNKFKDFLVNLLDVMKGNSDNRYRIQNNREYEQLVAQINTDGFDWLAFDMSDDEKLKLLKAGVEEARHFLEKFDWEGYKSLRQEISKEKL